MAQTGYTPIQLYRTTTAAAAPLAANLNAGELAININDADMALYAENQSGVVKRLMNNPAGLKYPTADGTANQIIKTDGSGNLTFVTPASPGTGTVTSVSGTGTVSGLTLSGTVTSSGSLTLGGSITGFLPTAGGTMTGNLTLDAYTEKVATLATSGTIALNPSTGTTLSCAAAGTVTFTDSLSSGQSISLLLTNGSTYTINWPTTTWVTAAGNTAPTLSANNTLVFWKISSTLYGALVGKSA
jgi:hypothetical protein